MIHSQAVKIALFLLAATPFYSFSKVDFSVTVGTLHGQLRFSPEVFGVKPGSRVSLTLDNSDAMIHNLLLAKGDAKSIDRIAEAALNLGEKGLAAGFIPKDPSIIASIGLVQAGEKSTIQFNAPLEIGDYPFVCTFPGHSLSMRGTMKVLQEPDLIKPSETKPEADGKTPRNGVIEVTAKPRVLRVHIAGVDSGRSIAVGLPGGFNYLFDAEKLMVRKGWTGAFINVTRDRRGRGGGLCAILGDSFEVGAPEFPLRVGNPSKVPASKFKGYSRLNNPTFLYVVDGVDIEQTTTGSPENKGLTYGFRTSGLSEDLFFLIEPESLTVSTTSGKWHPDKGHVHIPAKEGSEFFISVQRN